MKVIFFICVITIFITTQCISPHEKHALKKFEDEVDSSVFHEFMNDINILQTDQTHILYAANLEYVGYCGVFIKSQRKMMSNLIPVDLNQVITLTFMSNSISDQNCIIPDFRLQFGDFGVKEIAQVYCRTRRGEFLIDKSNYEKSTYSNHGCSYGYVYDSKGDFYVYFLMIW